jgi:nucleotide-binding universal stress UspA family protein
MVTATAKTTVRLENILFATDFSPAASLAIPYVKQIAKRYHSHIVAFHVRPPVVNPMTLPTTWPVDVEVAKVQDQEHAEQLAKTFAGLPCEVLVAEGDILSCLETAVKEHKIDLVVIGTRGRTGAGKLLLGSVAEEILRDAACPVLTVGPNGSIQGKNGEVSEILYATDFSAGAAHAARYAASLAVELGAKLTLVHVVPEPKPGDLVSWSDVQAAATEHLRRLVPAELVVDCKPSYFVERGNPAERIMDLAALREIGLIVLGIHAEHGVPGAATHLPIATAHKVVSRAACPVLTMRN